MSPSLWLRHRPLWVAAAALASAGVCSACPCWVSALGLDVWAVPELESRLAADRRLADDLAARDEEVLRRIVVKEQLIGDLVTGRAGLITTAGRFRTMDAGRPAHVLVIRSASPGATDDERICRQVILSAERVVAVDEAGRDVVRRLYDELHERMASGTLVVPGPSLDAGPPAAAVTAGGPES
jgi:hypothetical protein